MTRQRRMPTLPGPLARAVASADFHAQSGELARLPWVRHRSERTMQQTVDDRKMGLRLVNHEVALINGEDAILNILC